MTTPAFLPEKHFRLVLHPVTLRGRTKSSSHQRGLDLALTVSNVDLVRGRQNWIESILESHLRVDSVTKEQGRLSISESNCHTHVHTHPYSPSILISFFHVNGFYRCIVLFLMLFDTGGGPLPFLRLKVNHLYNNSVSSSRPEVSNITCDFGVIDVKYDRLLEARLVEMFGTSSSGASGTKKFESHSARPHEINLNFSCPRLKCDLRFQALEVANLRKELRPDALTVSNILGKI